MHQITVQQYEGAELEIQTEGARRGFMIHSAIFAVVQTGLILLNLLVTSDFIWFPFPLVGWGLGLTMHYLVGYRWVERELKNHQRAVEERASRLVRDPSAPAERA